MKENKLSIQSSIIWNSCGSIIYLACQWLLTILVVRLSDVGTAGILSLSMSTSNIWYALSTYGMRNFQISDTKNQYSSGTYIYSRIITCSIALLGCIGYVTVIAYTTLQKASILIYFIFRVSEALADVYGGIFQRKWRLDYAGKSMALRGILSLISFVLILLITNNIVYTLIGMAFVSFLVVLIYDIPRADKLEPCKINKNKEVVFNLLKDCFPLVLYTLLSTAIGNIPKIIMERTLGSYYLGVYSSVASPTLIIQMGASYVFAPFVTVFAEQYHSKNKDAFVRTLKKCIVAVAGISVIGLIGGKIFGNLGLQILYGAEIALYVELLMPLIICTILTAFAWFLCSILTAIREFKGLVLANVFAVIVATILSGTCESSYGMQGASLALGVATFVEILIMAAFFIRKMGKQF